MSLGLGLGLGLGRSEGGLFGFTPGNLDAWHTTYTNVRNGTAHALILAVGASATRGYGSAGVGNPNDPINTNSYPTQMIASLVLDGLPFLENGVCAGDLQSGGTDTRVNGGGAMPANWARTGGFSSLGGSTFLGQNTGTTDLPITPPNPFDTIRVWYVRNASNGDFTYNVDGGAPLATVVAGGTVAVLSSTSTVALGTHTINIQRTGAGSFPTGQVRVIGVDTWDSTTKRARLINCGQLSSTMADLVSTTHGGNAGATFGPEITIAAMAPDLVLLAVGGNDANSLTDIPTMKTCLASMITTVGVGKIIVASHTPVDVDDTVRRTYTDALKDTAKTSGVPFVDLTALMGTYAAENAAGKMFNTLHPNALGYADCAAFMKRAVLM